MANNDKRIDQLIPSTIPLAGTDLVAIYNANGTRNDSITNITSYVAANMAGITPNDTYVTGTTLNVNSLELGRNQGLSTLTVDLSPLITSNDTYVTGSTLNVNSLELSRNQGLSTLTVDLSSLLFTGATGAFRHTATGSINPTNTYGNVNTNNYSSILGGSNNILSAGTSNHSLIVGGDQNEISGSTYAFIGGGILNTIKAGSHRSSIVGGRRNTIGFYNSTIAGGYKNKMLNTTGNIARNSFIGGGTNNYITSVSFNDSQNFIGAGQNNLINISENSSIVGGGYNVVETTYSNIGGGYDNNISSSVGQANPVGFPSKGATAPGTAMVIAGGYSNGIFDTSEYSSILGGWNNVIFSGAGWSIIGGGWSHRIHKSKSSAIFGGGGHEIYNCKYSTVTGGYNNDIIGTSSVNSGYATIVGGYGNLITGDSDKAFIGGGQSNIITNGDDSTILGGDSNAVNHDNSHIIGSNITSVSANTTHVQKLNIGTLNGTAINVGLGLDINGMVVSGDTSSTFNGNTSGDCITDIHVSNIHSCSPLQINPLDEGNVYFGSGHITESSNGLSVILTGATTKMGINVPSPGYTLHMSGDLYIPEGSVGIGESPDPTQKVRITTSDADGANTTALRVDMSYIGAQTGGVQSFVGGQFRSVPNKTNNGITQQWGVSSNLTSSVSVTGTHMVVGGRFRANSTNADNYGIQIEDGTEVAGRVLVCQPTSLYGQVGLAHWGTVGVTGVTSDSFVINSSLSGNTLIFDRNDNTNAFNVDLTPLSTFTHTATGSINPTNAYGNVNNSNYSSILGGYNNLITGSTYSQSSVIGGGYKNVIGGSSTTYSTWSCGILNGYGNKILGGASSTIVGGASNVISGPTLLAPDYSTIVGGWSNTISNNSNYNTIGGGYTNNISGAAVKSSIGGGQSNNISGAATLSSIGGGQSNNILGAATLSSIGGGQSNSITSGATKSFVGGGDSNSIIGGNGNNIVGGKNNYINATDKPYGENAAALATKYLNILGGYENKIDGGFATDTIIGGYFNTITGATRDNFIGGGWYNSIGSRLEGGAIGTLKVQARNIIIGGGNNAIDVISTFDEIPGTLGGHSIIGGVENIIHSTTGGTNFDKQNSIVGGYSNTILNSNFSIIGSGSGNTINEVSNATILGGEGNTINHNNSHILGSNITSVSAETSHVEKLNIGTISSGLVTGSTSVDNIGIESNGMVIKGFTTKVVEIGDWDMDATSGVTVAHSLSASEWKTIRKISTIVRDDADTTYRELNGSDGTTMNGGTGALGSVTVELTRITSGIFDNTNWDVTSYNRGWVTFDYIKD